MQDRDELKEQARKLRDKVTALVSQLAQQEDEACTRSGQLRQARADAAALGRQLEEARVATAEQEGLAARATRQLGAMAREREEDQRAAAKTVEALQEELRQRMAAHTKAAAEASDAFAAEQKGWADERARLVEVRLSLVLQHPCIITAAPVSQELGYQPVKGSMHAL